MVYVIIEALLCTVLMCMYILHISPMSYTALTYAGDEHDYENCTAAMRNIDPDCNVLTTDNFANTRYHLKNDINDVIKRNNLSAKQFSLMRLNIRNLPKNIGKLSDFLSLIDNRFSINVLSETWLYNDNLDLYELPENKSIHFTRPSKKFIDPMIILNYQNEYHN